jgi:hypothetical protein
MSDLRESRRRQYLGNFAHQYARFNTDDAAVYLTVGRSTWDTLDRVTPEVEA